MIIQSDSISMNSRRSYNSSQASYSNTTRWNQSGATIFTLQSGQFRQEEVRQGQLFATGDEQENVSEKKTNRVQTMNLWRI